MVRPSSLHGVLWLWQLVVVVKVLWPNSEYSIMPAPWRSSSSSWLTLLLGRRQGAAGVRQGRLPAMLLSSPAARRLSLTKGKWGGLQECWAFLPGWMFHNARAVEEQHHVAILPLLLGRGQGAAGVCRADGGYLQWCCLHLLQDASLSLRVRVRDEHSCLGLKSPCIPSPLDTRRIFCSQSVKSLLST